MQLTREWILGLAGAVCFALAIWSAFLPPLVERGIFEILLYEIVVALMLIGILTLMYKRGAPGK